MICNADINEAKVWSSVVQCSSVLYSALQASVCRFTAVMVQCNASAVESGAVQCSAVHFRTPESR